MCCKILDSLCGPRDTVFLKVRSSMGSRFFLTSKRVQGALVACIGVLLSVLGLDVTESEVAELAGNILAVAGTLWHLYGQYRKSDRPMRLRPGAKK
jgi:hypothetical protein